MAKKEIFETICIFFCDRLKTKIKNFEKLKAMLQNLNTSVHTGVLINSNVTFYQGRVDPTSWSLPGQLAGLE